MSAGREAPELTRLGTHMERRAAELGLTWIDVARISGVDRETLRKLRYGLMGPRGAAPRTKYAVAQALRWTTDSIDRANAGQDPIPLAADSDHTRTAQAGTPGDEPHTPGGATPEEVLNHLQAALQLGGADYFWQAMIKMNRLHNPLVEPTQPHDTGRTA